MKLLVALALIPLAQGPSPQEERKITVSLCNGGTFTIPSGGNEPEPENRHQGCHAISCRKKIRTTSC